jgi:hypothetical protein
MPKITKKHYKRNTKQKKQKKIKRSRITRKMKGGVSFNPVFSTNQLPNNSYYDLNKYGGDPSRPPDVVASRLLPNMTSGGKKSNKKRSHRKKMKGGSLIGTDLLTGINTQNTNSALAFGTTGGTNYMLNTLAAKEIPSGSYMSSETPLQPNLV